MLLGLDSIYVKVLIGVFMSLLFKRLKILIVLSEQILAN